MKRQRWVEEDSGNDALKDAETEGNDFVFYVFKTLFIIPSTGNYFTCICFHLH